MSRLFLYRLFKHSKTAFWILIIFIGCYAITFYKKMDMIFFPYNSMFAIGKDNDHTAATYGMKVNDQLITITDKPYWKKDFLESSLNNYGKFLFFGNVPMGLHHVDTFSVFKNLVPDSKNLEKWPLWFAAFAGYKLKLPARVDIFQYYNIKYSMSDVMIRDSALAYSKQFKNN